jgi:hypothetical protein
MTDDYLWDGSPPADPEVEKLERALRPLAFRPEALDLDRPAAAGCERWTAPAKAHASWWLGAAAAVLSATAALLWLAWPATTPADATAWDVQPLAGEPRIAGRLARQGSRWAEGEELRTDARSRARASFLHGHLEVDPDSRVRLLRATEREQRLRLDHGLVRARVVAPPRLFLMETPSALAVDLGCAYVLRVDEAGAGLLVVTEGQVALVEGGVESVVPAGAFCRLRPDRGPGTPCFQDASVAFRAAVERFDQDADADALEEVLAEARPRDGITLWHVLQRATDTDRRRVYERLSQLAPPVGLSEEAVLRLDPQALAEWRRLLGHGPLSKKKALRLGGVR